MATKCVIFWRVTQCSLIHIYWHIASIFGIEE
jgi:hypothetical protein